MNELTEICVYSLKWKKVMLFNGSHFFRAARKKRYENVTNSNEAFKSYEERSKKKTVAICVSFAVLWIKICVMKIKMCIHFGCDRVVRRWKKMCAFGQLTKLVHEISFNATTIQFHWIHKFPTFIALKLHFNRRHSRKKTKITRFILCAIAIAGCDDSLSYDKQ